MGLGTRRARCQESASIRIMSSPTLFPILPAEKPRKKPVLLGCAIVLALLTMGFFAGRGYQHLKNGYNYSVRDDKSYPFREGTIHLRHVFESVGFALMDTGKTVIETSDGRIFFKAQRGFQEATPVATNFQVDGNTLRWDDGEFRYTLKMEAMPPEKPEAAPEAKATEATP